MNSVDNTQDVIDSRDVIERIEELESEREALADDVAETQEEFDAAKESLENAEDDDDHLELERAETQAGVDLDAAKESLQDWDESEDADELKILKALAEECEGYSDWIHGETLIRDSYFEEYAQQLAEDVGCIDHKLSNSWPYTCIDWERAARELQYDYSSVWWGDICYWIRS